MSNRVVAFKEQELVNFNWAVRPITLWMRFFAIPLIDWKALKQSSLTRYVFTLFFATTCYVFNLTCHWYIASLPLTSNASVPVTATDWNNFITNKNFTFSIIASHTALLVFTARQWRRLTRSASRLDQLLQSKDWRRIRRLAVLCFILLLIGLIAHMSSIAQIVASQESLWFAIRSLTLEVTNILPMSGGFLFCLLNKVACVAIESLRKDVKHYSHWSDITIGRVRKDYGLISHYVGEVDNSFGAVGLILISSVYIRIINNSFFILVEYQNRRELYQSIFPLVYIVKDFALFAVLIYTSHRMGREAIGLAKTIDLVQGLESSLQNQVNQLAFQILLCPPKTTAGGFFNIDLHLMPTLVGTTLTYIIILCQFEYA